MLVAWNRKTLNPDGARLEAGQVGDTPAITTIAPNERAEPPPSGQWFFGADVVLPRPTPAVTAV